MAYFRKFTGFCGGLLGLLLSVSLSAAGAPYSDGFKAGLAALQQERYETAVQILTEETSRNPSAGAFLNLGNAQWKLGRTGYATLCWERALWIDPQNAAAQNNLQFARKAAQLDAPNLTWYEVASTWLPPNWWAWLAGISLWVAVSAAMLPGILRVRRAAWHQAIFAFGLVIFLLSLPAHLGVLTRSRLGFVLEPDTPLKLTPTHEGQFNIRLAAGEPVRFQRARGEYVFVRTLRSEGWIDADVFGRLVPGRAKNPR